MSNIVLLDREVRKTGRERWDEKNQKKYGFSMPSLPCLPSSG